MRAGPIEIDIRPVGGKPKVFVTLHEKEWMPSFEHLFYILGAIARCEHARFKGNLRQLDRSPTRLMRDLLAASIEGIHEIETEVDYQNAGRWLDAYERLWERCARIAQIPAKGARRPPP